jgi:hypothetical protein
MDPERAQAGYLGTIETAGEFLGDLGVEQGASHSGHEANDVFVNGGGDAFVDLSRLSGFDHRGDGRSVVRWDYDRDGRMDLAVAGANAPLLQVFHNEVEARFGTAPNEVVGGSVSVRLHGGNSAATPSERWSSRDACGARVVATIGARRLLREHRCGEGLAAQNSAWVHFGLGAAARVDGLQIRWPSGRSTEVGPVAAGSLVEVFERPADAATTDGVEITSFDDRVPASSPPSQPSRPGGGQDDRFPFADLAEGAAPLQLYTSMATWCASCRGELPWMAALRAEVPAEKLGLVGLPVDPEDTPEQLAAWRQEHEPAYALRDGLTGERRTQARDWLVARTGREALPSSVVTDGAGRILLVRSGVPTRSELRRLMRASEAP